MPMKPTSPESLKGLAGTDSAQARVLDDEEVERLQAQAEEDEEGEGESGEVGAEEDAR